MRGRIVTRTVCAQTMTNTPEVPAWIAVLIERMREAQQRAELFELRELPSEAHDAEEERLALIRHLARRLKEPGL